MKTKRSHVMKTLRIHAGMTQERLAQASGVSQVTLSRLENGHQVSDKMFLRIADALGYDFAHIVYLEDQISVCPQCGNYTSLLEGIAGVNKTVNMSCSKTIEMFPGLRPTVHPDKTLTSVSSKADSDED